MACLRTATVSGYVPLVWLSATWFLVLSRKLALRIVSVSCLIVPRLAERPTHVSNLEPAIHLVVHNSPKVHNETRVPKTSEGVTVCVCRPQNTMKYYHFVAPAGVPNVEITVTPVVGMQRAHR